MNSPVDNTISEKSNCKLNKTNAIIYLKVLFDIEQGRLGEHVKKLKFLMKAYAKYISFLNKKRSEMNDFEEENESSRKNTLKF